MSLYHDRIIQLLKTLKKQSIRAQKKRQHILDIYQFYQCLLYGKPSLIKQFGITSYVIQPPHNQSSCSLYIHENHFDILIININLLVGLNNLRFFNLRKIQIYHYNAEIQMDANVQDKYLLLQQQQDKAILIFKNEQRRNQFKQKLQTIKIRLINLYVENNTSLIKAFIKTDINQNQQISYQQLNKLFKNMNIVMDNKIINFLQKILKIEKIQQKTTITSSDFQKIWKIFYCRQELLQVFLKYCGGKQKNIVNYDEYLKPMMTIEGFKEFLAQQQIQISQQQKNNIIKHLHILKKQSNNRISFYEFSLFIFDFSNLLMSNQYEQQKISSDKKDQPLTSYYCYSSHNTYLTGNQLTSTSKGQRYFQDLCNGLRCVQIDIHDGDNQPVVKHGYTLTSEVRFQEVINFVNKFTKLYQNKQKKKQHTPIILSLEMHINVLNQIKVAKILQQTFGDRILRITQEQNFPSLERCKGMIIIKGPGSYSTFKQLQKKQLVIEQINQQKYFMIQQIDYDSDEVQQQDDVDMNYKSQKNIENIVYKSDNQNINDYYSKKNDFKKFIQQNKKNKKQFKEQKVKFKSEKQVRHKNTPSVINYKLSGKSKIPFSLNLFQLITLLSKKNLPKKVQSIIQWQSNSFSERKIQQIFSLDKQSVIQTFSRKQWFRSYPGGFRVNSSNYNPLPAMQLGIQIIAMNSQKQNDVYNNILRSFFRKGRAHTMGYRLKPEINVLSTKKTFIQIQFLSALRIYFNQKKQGIPNVQIHAYFIGTSDDSLDNQYFTKRRLFTDIIEGNSFNPIFTQPKTMNLSVRNLELGFIVVQIQDCGRNVIPLDSLKNGYRTIVLLDNYLKQKQSKILCKINKYQ